MLSAVIAASHAPDRGTFEVNWGQEIDRSLQCHRVKPRVAAALAAATCIAATSMACERWPARPTGAPVPVSNAEHIVRYQVQPGVRDCYNEALRSDPNVHGTAKMVIHVAPDGSVEDAPTAGDETLPPSLLSCITAVGRSVRFDPPGGSGASIGTRFNFKKAGAP
jgi:hypothetical protein